MTNLEMFVDSTREGMSKRADVTNMRALQVAYITVRLSGEGDDLKRAWRLNEIAKTILSGPMYLFPTA